MKPERIKLQILRKLKEELEKGIESVSRKELKEEFPDFETVVKELVHDKLVEWVINNDYLRLTKDGKIYLENLEYKEELREFRKATLDFQKRQVKIQEELKELQKESQDTIKKQSDISHNTFLIYFAMAFVMFFQLALLFISSQLKVTLFGAILAFLIVGIAGYVLAYIHSQMRGGKIFKGNLTLVYVGILVLMAVIIIILGYYFNLFELQSSIDTINGTVTLTGGEVNIENNNVNFTNLDSVKDLLKNDSSFSNQIIKNGSN